MFGDSPVVLHTGAHTYLPHLPLITAAHTHHRALPLYAFSFYGAHVYTTTRLHCYVYTTRSFPTCCAHVTTTDVTCTHAFCVLHRVSRSLPDSSTPHAFYTPHTHHTARPTPHLLYYAFAILPTPLAPARTLHTILHTASTAHHAPAHHHLRCLYHLTTLTFYHTATSGVR